MTPSPQAPWLEEARRLFAGVYGRQRGPLYVVLANELGETLRLALPAVPEPDAPLSPLQQAVLETLRGAAAPLGPKALAKRSGYKYNSHFRRQLADLSRRGLLHLTPDGYALPGEP